jgi:hypothetical protein
MNEYTVILKVQAETVAEAIESACERLAAGGDPDAILTCPVRFPDPEIEGAEVTI